MFNIRLPVSQTIAIFILASVLHVQSQAQSATTAQGCTITEHSCPCSQSNPSGSCLKNQADGTCLLGVCKASYRCDCLGYQMCKKSKCAVFTATQDAIPSETRPFGCHLTPDAGSCTTFDYFIDTVEAALNAKIDAAHSNNEALFHSVEAQQIVAQVHDEDLLVNDELLTIDSVRHQMTAQEEDVIYSTAKVIKDSVTKCARDALNISMEASQSYDWNLNTANHARDAVQAEKDGTNAQHKLEQEHSKAVKENRNCGDCKQLEHNIQRLKELRKQAAVNAGKSAKGCAKNKDTATVVLSEIRDTRVRCGLARGKVLSEIAKLKKRLALS